MPFLRQPMELREAPSLARRTLRVAAIVVLTASVFILGLAVFVVAVTD